MDEAYTGDNVFWLVFEKVTGECECFRIDVHSRNVEAAAGQQDLQDTLAASYIEYSLPLYLLGDPVNAPAKDIVRFAPLDNPEVDL